MLPVRHIHPNNYHTNALETEGLVLFCHFLLLYLASRRFNPSWRVSYDPYPECRTLHA